MSLASATGTPVSDPNPNGDNNNTNNDANNGNTVSNPNANSNVNNNPAGNQSAGSPGGSPGGAPGAVSNPAPSPLPTGGQPLPAVVKYSGPIKISPNVLRIYKVNNAGGALVHPGDTVHFKIVVDNDGNNTLNSLVVTDSLTAPNIRPLAPIIMKSGQCIQDRNTPMSTIWKTSPQQPGREFILIQHIVGLNDSLQSVRSLSDALSSFTLAKGNSSTDNNIDSASPNSTSTDLSLNNKLLPNLLGTPTSTSPSLAQLIGGNGQVLGTACVQPSFKNNLLQGSNSADVKALQVYLNSNGFIIAKKGAGSPGHETTSFRRLLKVALTKFQISSGIKERGVFGLETRNKLNSILNSSGMPFCPPPVVLKPAVKKLVVLLKAPVAKIPASKQPAIKLPVVKSPVVNAPAPKVSKPTAVKKFPALISAVLKPLAFMDSK